MAMVSHPEEVVTMIEAAAAAVPAATERHPPSYTHTCRGTGHRDSFDSSGAAAAFSPSASPLRTSKFVARLGGGARLVTFVTWAGF